MIVIVQNIKIVSHFIFQSDDNMTAFSKFKISRNVKYNYDLKNDSNL
jgi:hypothetical protein